MTDTPAPPPPPQSFDAVKVEPQVSQASAAASTVITPPPTTYFSSGLTSGLPTTGLLPAGFSTALVPTSGYSIDDFGSGGYGYGVPFSSYAAPTPYSSRFLPGGYGPAYSSPLLPSAYTPPTSLFAGDYYPRGDYYTQRIAPSVNRTFAPRGKYSHPLHAVYRLDYNTSRRRPAPASYRVPDLPPVPGAYFSPPDPQLGYIPYFPRPNPRLPDSFTYNFTPYRPYAGMPRYAPRPSYNPLPGWSAKYSQQRWKRGWGI